MRGHLRTGATPNPYLWACGKGDPPTRLDPMTPMLFDIGTGELIAIVVIAAILMGPEKVPEMAKKAARVLKFLRGVANNATEQIKGELGPEYADMKLTDLTPKNMVQKLLPDDTKSELDALREELNNMRTQMTELQATTASEIQSTGLSPEERIALIPRRKPPDPDSKGTVR